MFHPRPSISSNIPKKWKLASYLYLKTVHCSAVTQNYSWTQEKREKGLPLTFHIPNFLFSLRSCENISLDSWKVFSSFSRPTFASASFEMGLKPICSVFSFLLRPFSFSLEHQKLNPFSHHQHVETLEFPSTPQKSPLKCI